MIPRQQKDQYWWGAGKIDVGFGEDRTKDDVTANGEYFIMLEEETVGRLAKYIDMQDNYMEKKEGMCKVLLFYDVYNNIFLILYFTYLRHRVLSENCLLSELFIELHTGLDWNESPSLGLCF